MKVVEYARVSSRRQAEDGLGLPVQVEGIDKWAQAHGHQLVAVVTDEGISGTRDAWDRPGLTEALPDRVRCRRRIRRSRLDRLARLLTVQEGILAHLWKRGTQASPSIRVRSCRTIPTMRTAMRQWPACSPSWNERCWSSG